MREDCICENARSWQGNYWYLIFFFFLVVSNLIITGKCFHILKLKRKTSLLKIYNWPQTFGTKVWLLLLSHFLQFICSVSRWILNGKSNLFGTTTNKIHREVIHCWILNWNIAWAPYIHDCNWNEQNYIHTWRFKFLQVKLNYSSK